MGFTDRKGAVEGRFERGFFGQSQRYRILRRIILAQIAATLLISTLLLWLDWIAAYSALLGGFICTLPNAYLAQRISSSDGVSALQSRGRLIVGEATKLALSAFLFAVVFVWVRPLNPVALFCAWLAIHAVHWVVPLIDGYRKSG